MAGKSNTSATFFAQKKLLGKAHTSNLKTDGEELIGSNIQAASSLLFGQTIPENPATTLHIVQSASNGGPATVEYIHFALNALTGTTYDANETSPDGGAGSDSGEASQTSGTHTYKFVFKSDYESNSNNPKKGNGDFNNGQIVHETLGRVQLIPPFFSQNAPNPYIVKIYKDDGSGGIGDEIPLLDNIDWNVDFYNGILFLQDFNSSKIPAHAKAFAYVGDFADKGFFENSLSGSLQKLTDGSSYLVAGNNITISSASNGQVTIASSGGGSDTQNTLDQAYDEGGTGLGAIITVDNQPVQLKVAGSSTVALAVTGSVLIGSGADGFLPDIPGNDVNFFVSGTIGSRGSSDKGTSVFGGDVVISGNLKTNKELVFNELLSGATNNSNTLFTLANTPFSTSEISIFVNGQLQTPPDLTTFQDYSVTGSNVFFTSGSTPDHGSLVMAIYQKVVT